MAIAPTGAIYKSLSFDGEDSRNYGVYITGEAVYNAPERDVEMITIPGRNGSFALDNGRFENIEVSYPAGIFAENEADFRQAISDFRNFLCSRKGYVRLQDEYNPDEYRMAVYKSGLEVDPAMLRAGEFTITFDCKPQRWLMSGEAALDIASGSTLMNPTLFEASPLLEVEGYGSIGFNGYEIELENGYLGNVVLAEPAGKSGTYSFSNVQFNVGDTITVQGGIHLSQIYSDSRGINNLTHTEYTNIPSTEISVTQLTSTRVLLEIDVPDFTFTACTYETHSCHAYLTYQTDASETKEADMGISASYYRYILPVESMSFSWSGSGSGWTSEYTYTGPSAIVVNSTLWRLGDPTYIDCDLGECYMIKGDTPISLNQYIDLGSQLPTLASGPNAITYDNTITELKITPRYWKV